MFLYWPAHQYSMVWYSTTQYVTPWYVNTPPVTCDLYCNEGLSATNPTWLRTRAVWRALLSWAIVLYCCLVLFSCIVASIMYSEWGVVGWCAWSTVHKSRVQRDSTISLHTRRSLCLYSICLSSPRGALDFWTIKKVPAESLQNFWNVQNLWKS